jgi:hypothetical protein
VQAEFGEGYNEEDDVRTVHSRGGYFAFAPGLLIQGGQGGQAQRPPWPVYSLGFLPTYH